MAYNVSPEYKTALKSNVIVARSYFWILSGDISTDVLVSDNTFLKSWKLENLCYDDRDNSLIGNTIAKKLDLKMINTFAYSLEDKEIELYSGIVLNPDDDPEDWESEYVSHGNFIVQPVENKEVPSIQEFVAYDYMVKFNAQFSTGALTYPCTLLEMLEHICDSVGVALAGTGTYEVFEPFANQNFVITQGEALEDYTYRQILSRICKLSGTIATINSNNELQLRSFGQEVVDTMDSNHYYTFEKNAEYGELNEVVLKSYDITGENITKQDAESIAEYGLTSMSINEELFAYTQDLRNEIIDGLFAVLFGAKYTGFKARTIGFNYFDALDKVTITSTQDLAFDTYIFNQVINFDMGKLTVDFTTTALTSAEEEYKNIDNQELVNQRTEIIVNKHEGKIVAVTQEIVGLQKQNVTVSQTLEGITTEVNKIAPLQKQTNELKIKVDGIENTMQYKGGYNLIYNSVKQFGNDGYTGAFVTFQSTDTINNLISKSAIMLDNGTDSTTISLPNGQHNFSAMYKKLISGAVCTITVNGEVLTLTETDWTSIDLTFEVSDNTVVIEYDSNTDSSCLVGDVLLILGDTKQVWTPNPNEIYTDTVKISRGIEVSSNTSNTKLLADTDGTRVVNKSTDEVVAEFTDDGTVTKDITAERGNIGEILITDMGTQTWLNRL